MKFYVEEQKYQQQLIKWLRSLNLDVEGRMYIYLNQRMKNQSQIFGYSNGLPQIEIHNQRGTYTKCGIYLKKLNDSDLRIKKKLENEGYRILFYNKKIPIEAIKTSILQNYINLSINRKRKRIFVKNEAPNRKRRKKSITGNQPINEKEFHKKLIKNIRNKINTGELPSNLILEGRIQGNIKSKKINAFSNRQGYIIDSPDITIKNRSPFGYTHLDIELKIKDKKPRRSQREFLLNYEKKYNHFPCYINTECGEYDAINKTIKLIKYYKNGPKRELLKYKLK